MPDQQKKDLFARIVEEQSKRNKPGPKGEAVWGTVTKKGKVIGRQRVVVPPDEVEHLASLGCTNKEIAEYFQVSESTLAYNFTIDLTKGRHQLRTTLRQAQLRTALTGNAAMLIWLGKNILGQTDNGLAGDSTKVLPWTDDDIIDAEEVEDFPEDLPADYPEDIKL